MGHQIFFEKVKIKKKKYLSFLPGSRLSEINNNIDKFVLVIEKSLQRFSDYEFFLLTFKRYRRLIKDKLKKFGSKIKVILTKGFGKMFKTTLKLNNETKNMIEKFFSQKLYLKSL